MWQRKASFHSNNASELESTVASLQQQLVEFKASAAQKEKAFKEHRKELEVGLPLSKTQFQKQHLRFLCIGKRTKVKTCPLPPKTG